jgi:phenylacetate-CoA ligase
MQLQVEAADHSETLKSAIEQAVRDITKLRADVSLVAVGSLPNDGKVIEDARSYK